MSVVDLVAVGVTVFVSVASGVVVGGLVMARILRRSR